MDTPLSGPCESLVADWRSASSPIDLMCAPLHVASGPASTIRQLRDGHSVTSEHAKDNPTKPPPTIMTSQTELAKSVSRKLGAMRREIDSVITVLIASSSPSARELRASPL